MAWRIVRLLLFSPSTCVTCHGKHQITVFLTERSKEACDDAVRNELGSFGRILAHRTPNDVDNC
jgi:hypothetical protein